MGNILTEYSDRIRYTIHNNTYGTISIIDPIGWDEDEKEFTRNKTNHGVFTSFSNSLKFTKDSKEFIQLVYDTLGINADIRLVKEAKNELTDIWENTYSGYLDLSTYELENNQISCKFNSGGLESVLKSREGEDVEIDRTETIDGKLMDELETVNLELKGRKIFLESIWKVEPMNYYQQILVESSDGNTRHISNTIPTKMIKKSHDEANATYIGMNGTFDRGEMTMMLIAPVNRTREFSVSVTDLIFECYTVYRLVDWAHVNVSLVRYGNGSNFNVIERQPIWTADSGSQSRPYFPEYGGVQNVNSNNIFTLHQNESLGLEVLLRADLRGSKADFNYKFSDGKIIITEDSYFDLTVTKAVKPFHLAERLIEIITNRKSVLKSEILQHGKFKDLLLTHGFWIRGFDKNLEQNEDPEDNKYKPLTTSFKDFLISVSAVANLGMGIERTGQRENVVIEELKYFYNRNVTIKLPFQVSDVRRSVDTSNYYSSINIGFEKGGNYEEAQGLDEYNLKNTYSTCIHRVSNIYNAVSKYNADSQGIEFARRKPFIDYSTEDTNYDQNIYFIDSKLNGRGNDYTVRLWQDDFLNVPTGIYSPETAFNLRLTPFNNLLRHGWVISSGLTKYPNDKIKYSSSSGNSKLKTNYREDGEIFNSDLERARFVGEIVKFKHICTNDLLAQIEGSTTILNKNIKNCYGLIEFINENNELERGYLLSLKPNGSGEWELLKYNM